MTALRRSLLVPILIAVPAIAMPVRAEDPAAPAAGNIREAGMAPKFLRLVDNGAAGGKLETADVTYKNTDGTTVCLVSAIHIGEKAYFEGLNESFKKYDAVLYELVKPKDAAVPVPGAPPATGSGVAELQRMMKNTLNLDFQLDVVDYSAKNFVHADLDAETFEKMQTERGETFPMLMMKNFMKAMSDPDAFAPAARAGQENPEDQLKELVRVFTRPDSDRQLKMMLARQMVEMETAGGGLGIEEGSVILTERNNAALKVLDDTLKQGKKNVAVFYGAAHMPELEKRLGEKGFKPVATEWRQAWDLNIRADQPSAIEDLLIDAVETLMEEGADAGDVEAEGEKYVETE